MEEGPARQEKGRAAKGSPGEDVFELHHGHDGSRVVRTAELREKDSQACIFTILNSC